MAGPSLATALGITQVGIEAVQGTPVPATRRVPSMATFKIDKKNLEPKEQRGSFDQSYDIIPLSYTIPWTLKHEFYASSSLWMLMSTVSKAPVITTNPSSPTVLLASTQASGTLALTTQPADQAHGRLLIAVNNTTGAPTAAGTITVTGTPVGGAAGTTEVITQPIIAAGVTQKFATNTCWSNVSNIACSVVTVGVMVAVNGFTDFVWTFTPTNLPAGLATMTFEEFNGVSNWQYPLAFSTGLDLDWAPEKAFDASIKGFAQQQSTLGGGLTPLALPTDKPFTGANATCFIDPVGGTPGTTSYVDVLTYKIAVNLNSKAIKTGTGVPYFDRWVRGWLTSEVDLEVDFTGITEYSNFQNDINRYFQTVVNGPRYFDGVLTQTSKVTITTPLRYETYEIDRTKDNVTAKIKGKPFVDPTLGYSYQIAVNCLQPSTTGL